MTDILMIKYVFIVQDIKVLIKGQVLVIAPSTCRWHLDKPRV